MAQRVWILDIATDPAEASFNVDVLKTLSVGESFELRVDRDVIYSVRIDETGMAENGDRTWFGSIENVGLDYSSVITVGKQTAHVVLTSPSGIYQLYGIRIGGGKLHGLSSNCWNMSGTTSLEQIRWCQRIVHRAMMY